MRKRDNWAFIEQKAQWGDRCDEIDDNDKDTLRIYCQNVNGIYDGEGIAQKKRFTSCKQLKQEYSRSMKQTETIQILKQEKF